MKIVWRWKASSKFSCNRICLMSFPSHFLSQGIGSTCGGILCLAEPAAVKLSSGSRSLSRAGIQGKSKECQSLCRQREGCPSVPLGTDVLGHSHSACGAGFVSALGWWRQPHLPCPAHTGAVAQRLVWPVLQVSAGQILCPWDLALSLRASGAVCMWDLCTQLLGLLIFAPTPGQENGAAPGLGIILLMVVTMLCQYFGASA